MTIAVLPLGRTQCTSLSNCLEQPTTTTLQVLSPFTMSANLADYELFKPLELAPGLTLKNRMVFSPCTRARSDIKIRCPNEENVKYYAARVSAGLILSEGCAVSEQG